MGMLDGCVAIVTGAGRGIGREHALALARAGAAVVVNDLGGASDGSGDDGSPAGEVVTAIQAGGGRAVANASDVADWDGARQLIDAAVEQFGRLDILVNNAGILRDRVLAAMTEDVWDSVIRVHLKGHFAPLHFAAEHWRARTKAGEQVAASVINTTSTSGLHASVGQGNYGAAKSGIATLSQIAAKELGRYGVRVNAVAPAARTRLIEQTPTVAALMPEVESGAFDPWDPANIPPLIVALAAPDCTVTGRVFYIAGGTVKLYRPWTVQDNVTCEQRWDPADMLTAVETLVAGAGQRDAAQ
jgi:NAD(P)-dependent dehydrogenase (short-subunit alcohol dehydrogenase family)